MNEARELPSGDMPIVVAARLSLSFPLLFSCVPLWAIDYEGPAGTRRLRKCWMTDGGLCHNFPVHLFDAACPRWPTFAFLLDQRLKTYKDQDAWLPIGEGAGRADNWQRGVPGVSGHGSSAAGGAIGLAMGMLSTMKDWNDRMAGRLPHVRNRMVRMALKADEGQLHIAMAGERIIDMAARYGPLSADKLIEAYLPQEGEDTTPAWRQQLYVRTMIELRSLRAHLRNFGLAAYSAGPTLPLRQLLQQASAGPILMEHDGKPHPPGTAAELSQADVREISRVLDAIEALERELAACTGSLERYHPKLEPEIRLRAPI